MGTRASDPGRPGQGAGPAAYFRFRYHDLVHYLASLLIASGADVKVVQAGRATRVPRPPLDTFGHLWPASDHGTRAAIDAVMAARADYLRTAEGGST